MRKNDMELVSAEATQAQGSASDRAFSFVSAPAFPAPASIREAHSLFDADIIPFDPRDAKSHREGAALANACREQTLGGVVALEGVGLHTGEIVHMTLRPAAAGHGIVFRRTDLDTSAPDVTDILARYDMVSDATMCTRISNAAGTELNTIEHIMAALSAFSIDNALIEIDGPEVPVMDGSSSEFVAAFTKTGARQQGAERKALRILKSVVVEEGLKRSELCPADQFRIEFEIDFDSPVIGRQVFAADIDEAFFADELGDARTFGFLKDLELMKSLGLARGGSLDNAVVISDDEILNEDGLRFDDEFVRHKVLDAVGDLALAGLPILGCLKTVRGGHAMNNLVLRALFADPSSYEIVTLREEGASVARPSLAIPAE
ncbi:MAG: UDP-3-O-acyl-N-acetylglucosamine deacetylase [Parvibaculaceae bacterium]|nr:UDP-3-O-acyl-N-acetylglucosamine deacetylase [Parvibaculaceae bacterium]